MEIGTNCLFGVPVNRNAESDKCVLVWPKKQTREVDAGRVMDLVYLENRLASHPIRHLNLFYLEISLASHPIRHFEFTYAF